VILTVTDNDGVTDSSGRFIPVGLSLSGSSVSNGSSWTAVVTATGTEGESTSGTWSHNGSQGGCEIPAEETSCSFELSGIPKNISSVTYTDGNDPGLTVTISKP
jgi:hypothetical protein